MSTRKLLSALISTAFIGLAGAASAAIVPADETFSPTALNGGGGAIGTAANFTARGFQSNLTSTFTISSNTGAVTVAESGNIFITSFQDSASNTVASGVGLPGAADYSIGGTFSLSGTGSWTGNVVNLNPVGASLTVNLYANYVGSNPATGTLIGTASLDPTAPGVAFAMAFGSLTPGSSGAALTSLTGGLNFTPVAGYSGPGGFFQTIPPAMILSIGNAGGNPLNTGYSVDASGAVSFFTPIPGGNQGTANVTFAQNLVPEPGAVSLVGIALIGLAVVGRKKTKAALCA